MRPIVLTFVEYYLPGFRAGGPGRTIANLVVRLGHEFDFRIVTRDRDLGINSPYPDVPQGEWVDVGRARVCYSAQSALTLMGIRRLLRGTPHDVLYMNSLFNPMTTIRPLLLRKLGLVPRRPCVVAPRGELGAAALQKSAIRKRVFMRLARIAGLYSDVIWQASSEVEESDILTVFPEAATRIRVAPNIPAPPGRAKARPERPPGSPLRIVFLGRVSPMKNLVFALEVLGLVKVPVEFSICGPREDEAYWTRCKQVAEKLPPHVKIREEGALDPKLVPARLADSDLMFLPTRGENYGHAIAEALQAGTPVLISDRSPWRGLVAKGVGAELPLDDPRRFADAIEAQFHLGEAERRAQIERVSVFGAEIGIASDALARNRALFSGAVIG